MRINKSKPSTMKKVIDYVKDLPKPRPTTSIDTFQASPKGAATSGGFTGFFSGGVPGAVGGSVGGYTGIKVGEKTESLSKALGASFATGAASTALATSGLSLAKSALTGASASINPLGLGIASAIGGLSGVSGMMQGSCMGDVKDSGTAGMLLGTTMSALGGSPLQSVTGSIAGSVGGMVKDKKLKVLAGAGTGAALGAAAGALGGPAAIAVNAAMGALTGAVSAGAGNKIGQIQRNLTEDMQKGIFAKIKKFAQKLGRKGRIALGTIGGVISGLPLAVLGFSLGGPIGAAIPLIAMGTLSGVKVSKTLKNQEKIKKFQTPLKEFLLKDFTQEQIDKTPPQVIDGLANLFSQKYKNKDDFSKISVEQFRNDLNQFTQSQEEKASQAIEDGSVSKKIEENSKQKL